jgi:hypothetical protein
MENGVPADFLGKRRPPHHAVSGGGGDAERSHGLKINYSIILNYAAMEHTNCGSSPDGDRERAAVAKLIYAQRTALQLRRSSTSFGGAIVVKLDHQARTRGTSSRAASGPPSTASGRWVLELPFQCQRESGFAALRDILAVDDMGASQLNRTVVGDMHIHRT